MCQKNVRAADAGLPVRSSVHLADAVEIRRGGRARQIEERRQPVGVHHRGVDDASRRDARAADDERHAQAAFVEVALAGAERRVVGHARVRPFRHVQAAVVAGEDDDGALAQAGGVEMGEQAADAVVERLQRRGIRGFEGAGIGGHQRRPRRQERDVRVVVGEVEEERALAVRVDEALRLRSSGRTRPCRLRSRSAWSSPGRHARRRIPDRAA